MWNEVYRGDDSYYGTRPNDFLAEQVGKLSGRTDNTTRGLPVSPPAHLINDVNLEPGR